MKFCIFLVFLFVQYYCIEREYKVTFIVKELKKANEPCRPTSGSYLFYIECEFFSILYESKTLILNLLQPSNAQAICYPIEKIKSIGRHFSCILNLYDYIIDGNILLQLDVPESYIYIIKNWEEIIGASPGISNKVDNITCIPEAKAVFNITSIESNGCDENKTVFKLNGKWDKEIKNIAFKLEIDGFSKNAYCNYNKEKKYITFKLEGYGDIKIKEKYILNSIMFDIYLISGYYNLFHVDQCNNGKLVLINSIIFYKKYSYVII